MLKGKNLTPSPSLFPITVEYSDGRVVTVETPEQIEQGSSFVVKDIQVKTVNKNVK